MNDSSLAYDKNASPVKVTLKWFSPRKGFGFIVSPDGGKDIFLHISVVNASGHEELPDGTTLTCILGNGQKGVEVKQIISVDTSTASPRQGGFGGGDGFDRPRRREGGFGGGDSFDRPRRREGGFGGGDGFDRPRRESRGGDDGYRPSGGKAIELGGTVKWYNSKKGFGFVMPEDGSRDVFVHMSALRRSGLKTLDEGQSVRMRVVEGSKGQEADTIEIV